MGGFLYKLFDAGARPVRPGSRRPSVKKPPEKAPQPELTERQIARPKEQPAPQVAAPDSVMALAVPAPVEQTVERPRRQERPEVAAAEVVRPVLTPSAEPAAPVPEVAAAEVESEPAVPVAQPEPVTTAEPFRPPIQRLPLHLDEPAEKPRKTVPAEAPKGWVRPPILQAERKEIPVAKILPPPGTPPAQAPEPVAKAAAEEKPPAAKSIVLPDDRNDELDIRPLPSRAAKPAASRAEFATPVSNAKPQADAKRGIPPANGLTIHKLEIEIVERPNTPPSPPPVVAPTRPPAAQFDWPDRRNWRQVR